MKSGCKLIICVLCIIFCLGFLSGCGDTGANATATPAPDGSSDASASPAAQSAYLRPRSNELKNAVKKAKPTVILLSPQLIQTTPSPLKQTKDAGISAINRRNDYQNKYRNNP